MSTDDTAWLAGLLEGEGCFNRTNHSDRRPQIRVILKMGDRDVVARAGKLMGAPSIETVVDPRGEDWSTMYRVSVYGYKAERVMGLLRPHMGERRGAKIDELLSFQGYSHHPRQAVAA